MESVDINNVIIETVKLSLFFIKKKTDNFEFIPGEVPLIKGNFQKLQQVMLNLIQNSCQSLFSREKKITIKTVFNPEENQVEILVIDQGKGIDDNDINKVKERFFTTRRNNEGTGLGLSVSDSIIKEHGGELFISSSPGMGTEVRVIMPVDSL